MSNKIINKKVLLISYHFYPDAAVGARRPTKFAKSLSEQGYIVDLLTVDRGAVDCGEYINHVYTVKEYPDPINVVWGWVKGLKNLLFQNKDKSKESSKRKETTRQFSIEDSDSELPSESFYEKLARYIISFQALMSAKKLWLITACFKLVLLRLGGNHYQIIVTSSPPSAINSLGSFAKSVFSARWICDLRDPIIQWEAIYKKCISAPRVAIEERLEKKHLAKSDALIVTTPSYRDELVEKLHAGKCLVSKIHLIYNGYDVDYVQTSPVDNNEIINVVHAGSLYLNRNPFVFLLAVKQSINLGLISKKNIRVYFYGDCFQWEGRDVEAWVKNNKLEDVVFLSKSISLNELIEIYKQSDILLAFAQGQMKQIPAKMFEYLPYSGRIVAVTEPDSDTAQFLMQNELGDVVTREEEMIEVISRIYRNKLAGKNVNDVERKQKFSRHKQNQLLLNICDEFTEI